MIVNCGLRRFSGGGVGHILNTANFDFTPTDAGAGVATITLRRGTGSATYTRATAGWTKLSTGNWGSVASGLPRYCYSGADTTVTTTGGYLTELAGTQLTTPTAAIRDMTNGAWTATNVTPAKNATGIDGVVNSASTLTCTSNGGTILCTLVAAASTRTYSPFVRRKTGTGTITIQQGATTLDITALINSTTYTRVQLPASVLNVAYGFIFGTSGDAIEVDFNGFEAGNIATSPMDAAGAARNADALTYPTAGNISFTQGTCYAELASLLPTGQTAAATYIAVGTGGGAQPLQLLTTNATTTISCVDATTTPNKTGLTNMFTGIRKRASSWGAAGLAVTGDGAAPATGAFDGTMGSGANIGVGCTSAGTFQWNGIIKTVKIWYPQYPNPTLQAITA